MSERNYLLISAILFGLIAILHLVRVIGNWSIQIGTAMFPIWGSWLALLIAAMLCVWAFRLVTEWPRSHS